MAATAYEIQMNVEANGVTLPGTLSLPPSPLGVVIFAHGSGSSRFSSRNIQVAQSLIQRGCGTLLFDLLDPAEAADRRNVFDIRLLADRMLAATDAVSESDEARNLPIGYFGASTGAAAALVAAAERRGQIAAVVSRGGRPDLAGPYLPLVTAPTLLLVGSLDVEVIELNRQAQRMLRCENRLVIIEGATHLFEEPGTLEQVANEAGEWFRTHFEAAQSPASPRSPHD